MLVALYIALLASARVVLAAQPCYLSGYTLGESFEYHFASAVTVEKAVEHAGAAAQTHRAEHVVEMDASIQCVNIEDGGLYQFELRVHAASWQRPQTATRWPCSPGTA